MKYRVALFLILLMPLELFCYIDSDMDGVVDAEDRCKNTPFTDLVDEDGCSKEHLSYAGSFTLLATLSYADRDANNLTKSKTTTSALMLEYNYDRVSIGVRASYYKSEGSEYSESGVDDTTLTLGYSIIEEDGVYITLEAGVVLPTYKMPDGTNNSDYLSSINIAYAFEDINLFGLYSYLLVNDKSRVETLSYQNSSYSALGVGYFFDANFYASTSYSLSQSIYKGVEDIETLGLFGYYTLSDELFLNASYIYGLSESASDNYLSLALGYKF